MGSIFRASLTADLTRLFRAREDGFERISKEPKTRIGALRSSQRDRRWWKWMLERTGLLQFLLLQYSAVYLLGVWVL